MRAVLMAGGEGSRLRPLTVERPKPMVPVANRPLMEHILSLLRRHGILDILVTVHYRAEVIEDWFGDGSDHGVRLQYIREKTPLGTAGAVGAAREQLSGETFLVMSGDALTDCDLGGALEAHRQAQAAATLILARVPNPLEFGVVVTASDGRIERFLEKPAWSEVLSDAVNTGIYIVEPRVLDRIEPGLAVDWSADVFPDLLASGEKLLGWTMEGYWTDVGSLRHYREANDDALRGRIRGVSCPDVPFQVADTARIEPPVCLGRGVRIKAGAVVGPYTVLGDHVTVEEGAEVERSVVWESAYIGAGARISSAIIGARATIKRDVNVREEAVIGDRTLLDAGCTVRPRVRIWPDKTVERGSVVTQALIHGDRWRNSLFREYGVAGLSNQEITPELACRIGSAFGSVLKPGARVVTCRDSTRSSRMIKRALISALLGAGCEVLDLRSAPLPVARYFIAHGGASAAVNVRKLPGNRRVTLIELMDERGNYLSRAMERKVEAAFFREEFRRIDSDDLGDIRFVGRADEEYQQAFEAHVRAPATGPRSRIVLDLGYSPMVASYPAMLERLGAEAMLLNAFPDAKRAPRSPDEIQQHLRELRSVVEGLGADLGALFYQEGERLALIDGRGNAVVQHRLTAVLGSLMGEGIVALEIDAPSRLEAFLGRAGVETIRTKADLRSLMQVSADVGASFGADGEGGFIFPELHPGLDAMFALGKLLALLRETRRPFTEVAEGVPEFPLSREIVRVPWERKGEAMRRLVESGRHARQMDLLDGVKVWEGDAWVLVLPDPIEPLFHVVAEAADAESSRELAHRHGKKISQGLE
ncbi:mannose-1-phosphate guanyltransferase [soil metagenome]